MWITREGDLLISGTDLFISPLSKTLESGVIANVLEGKESAYLGMEIKKAPNELADGGNILMAIELSRAWLEVPIIMRMEFEIFLLYRVERNKRAGR